MNNKKIEILKIRRVSIYALFLSIFLNFIGGALNINIFVYLGLSLLGIYIFISLILWRCPFCKKRLPMRFNFNNVDEVVCPHCNSNLLYNEKNK